MDIKEVFDRLSRATLEDWEDPELVELHRTASRHLQAAADEIYAEGSTDGARYELEAASRAMDRYDAVSGFEKES